MSRRDNGHPPEKSPIQEEEYPIPEDVWYTDGFSKGNLSKWRAVAYHFCNERIWFEEGMVRVASVQNCEPRGWL